MTAGEAPRDDGLSLPEIGAWSETKYSLITEYAERFATAMKDKWGSRVYIDLFAGAGLARVKNSRKVVETSAFLALGVRYPFDRYVLCEKDAENAAALEQRIARHPLSAYVRIIPGDCNASVAQILAAVPRGSRSHGVLSFCVVDPFRLAHLHFATLEGLSGRFMDFLILIPSYMDAHRNLDRYLAPTNRVVADFTGEENWRTAWQATIDERRPQEFGMFVVDRFGQSMKRLGFLYSGLGDEVPVRTQGVLRYHIGFYSRNQMGMKFWRSARQSAGRQPGLL